MNLSYGGYLPFMKKLEHLFSNSEHLKNVERSKLTDNSNETFFYNHCDTPGVSPSEGVHNMLL